MWSLTFILPNAVILGSQYALGLSISTRSLVTNACIAAWGLRLAFHIGARHSGEDYRYVALRERMSKHGQNWYYFYAFVFIFMLQASLALIVNAGTLYQTAYHASTIPLGWKDYAGWAVFMAGFIIEAASDNQLTKHLADEDPNKGKFCKRGFWRYSRHPNYFGEALLWWGLYITTCSLPRGYWYFYSPLVITLLVRYVSGVPLLERKQKKHPEFARYEKETSVFIPWFYTELAADGEFEKIQ